MSNLLIIANILGYLGLVLIWLQVVFGSRHIFKYYTKDTVFINRLHKQIGIWGTLFIFVHPILQMVIRLADWSWLFIPRFGNTVELFISFGRFALIGLLIIWVTSAIVRENIKWRPWKYIHLLAYPILFLALIHVPYVGTFFENYFFMQVVWFLFFISFVFILIFRILKWGGVGKCVYVLTKKEFVGENIILVSFKPKNGNIITADIGQHFYLQLGRFQSEHPFTIMEQDKTTGELTFGIRKLGKTFDRLTQIIDGGEIFIDGPYGVFTREAWNDEDKIVISGGIGMTPFLDLVRNYGSSISYINCNRNINEAVKREVLMTCKKYIDVVDVYDGGGDNVRVGHISKEVIQEVVGPNFLKEKYFLCGSPMFVFTVRDLILSLGVNKEQVYFEELGF